MSLLDRFLSTTVPSRGRSGGARSATVGRTSTAIEQRIRSILHIRELESMPPQAARAFQLASDSRATAADFVGIIEKDEVLTARVIRIANSVYFHRGTAVTDIQKGVANIGLDELRCLLSSTMLRSLLHGTQRAREQIWMNGVAVALCCRGLSRYTSLNSGEAFLCGLLHDVGKLIMLRRSEKEYERVLQIVAAGAKSFPEAEEQVFNLTHTEVGKWVAEQWNFPASAVAAIALHHEALPELQDDTNTVVDVEPLPKTRIGSAELVQIADLVVHSLGIGHPPTFKAVRAKAEGRAPKALAFLGIPSHDVQSYLKSFEEQFHRDSGMYRLEQFTS